MAAKLRIGAVADRLGVSNGTVRAWERQGKIPPADRSRTGQRIYCEDQIALIERAIFGEDAPDCRIG